MRISDWSSDVCSSDLPGGQTFLEHSAPARAPAYLPCSRLRSKAQFLRQDPVHPARSARRPAALRYLDETYHAHRSEEHTSELQSLMRISYAVFCLKKKNNKNINIQVQRNPESHHSRIRHQ